MANELIVTITADNQPFKTALDNTVRTAQDSGKKIGNALDGGLLQAQKSVNTFSANAKSALGGLLPLLGAAGIAGAITAVGAGIVRLVKDTAAFGAQIADLSTKTGLTTRTLSALDTVLKQNDSSLGSFSGAMSILNRQLGEAQAGNKETAKTFQQLGVDIKATSEDALRQIIKRYQELPNEAQKSAFAMKVFGRSGAELIPTLDSLNGDLDATIKKMSDLGLVVTPEAAKAAEEFDDQLTILNRQVFGLQISIGNALIPELTNLIKVFTDAESSALDFFGVLQQVASFIVPTGGVLGAGRLKTGGGLTDPLEDQVNEALRGRGGALPSDLFDSSSRAKERKLTELEQLNKEIEETIKKTNALSDVNGALFKSTVALKVERLELAKREEEVQLAFEKTVGILRLPELTKDRDISLIPIDLQKLKETTGELKKLQELEADFGKPRTELSEMERFMRGFADATLTAGDAFQRLGENFADALLSGRNALQELGRAAKQFFNDLLGSALQATLRSAFGALFGGGGGGGGGAVGGILGSIFGGGGIGIPGSASAGRTPPFNPAASLFGGFGGGGGGLSFADDLGGSLNAAFGGGGGGVGSIFGNLSRSGALPLLGGSLGASLGGTSLLGNIGGGIGGALLGIGLTAAPTSGLLAGLAPLFSNPLTAIIGGGLLVGSIFLGKAKQRGKDEEASGEMIRAANEGINAIINAIRGDRIVGFDQARSVFEGDVITPFQQSISTLKTKSVVQSRLTNSVRDLRNAFDRLIPPEIQAQQSRLTDAEAARLAEEERRARAASIFSRQIPEFAFGGIVPGVDRGFDSVMALMRPGEMVLTVGQQRGIAAMAGGDVFNRVGVPASGQQVGDAQAFVSGGVARGGGTEPINITIDQVVVGISQGSANQITFQGLSSDTGRAVIIGQINRARTDRKL